MSEDERMSNAPESTANADELTPSAFPHHSPREGWVVLLDSQGHEVSERLPVVIDDDRIDDLRFKYITPTAAAWVRAIDADGVARDVPLDGEEQPWPRF